MLKWLSSYPLTSKRLAYSAFGEYISRYLGHLTEQRYPPKTMRKHADYLLSFAEFVEQQRGSEVSRLPELVEPFVTELASRRSSAPKVRQLLNVNAGLKMQRASGPIHWRESAVLITLAR